MENQLSTDDYSEGMMAIIKHRGELSMSLCFDRFSEDGITAYFKPFSWMSDEMVVISPPYKRLQTAFFNALDYYDRKYPTFGSGPHHMTYLRGELNEIGLPGFSVDKDKLEIGFDWKVLLHGLFVEEMTFIKTPEVYFLTS